MTENKTPNQEKDPMLLDHDYDGIQELDNFLPRWWLGIMYGTMLFAAVYFVYYHMGPGASLQGEWKREVAAMESVKANQAAAKQTIGEAELVAYTKDAEKLKVGKATFEGKCVSCHGPQGQGLVGPNLTDDYWIHGGKLEQILATVANGVGDKGMPPWGPILTEQELYSVVGYVKSLKGTNPPNPKAPQGNQETN